MSIKGNIGQPALDLATADTVVLDFTDRVSVTALSLFNKSGASRVVKFFESPNLTSASGKQVAVYTLATMASVDVAEIIGQGYAAAQNIVTTVDTGSTGDVNAKLTYIQYTGSS